MASLAKSTALPLYTLRKILLRFLSWWGRELSALMPSRLRAWWRASGPIVLLELNDRRAIFSLVEGEKQRHLLTIELVSNHVLEQYTRTVSELTRLVGKRFQLLICLPEENIYRRTVKVPIALEENLRQALSFELDRYTPFKADQAHFDFSLVERSPASRQLTVTLAVTNRSIVEAALGQAELLGLRADGIVLASDVLRGSQSFPNFMPTPIGMSHSIHRSWWRIGAAIAAMLLLTALLGIPIWQKRASAINLLAPLSGAKVAATEADALRDRLEKLVIEHNILIDKKWADQSVVLILDELSARLQDDTYLTQFEYDGKILTIQGESSSAAALVELLEASSAFKDVSFKSQLTKIQGTQYDRFHIAAALKSPTRPATPLSSEAPPPAGPNASAPPAESSPIETGASMQAPEISNVLPGSPASTLSPPIPAEASRSPSSIPASRIVFGPGPNKP